MKRFFALILIGSALALPGPNKMEYESKESNSEEQGLLKDAGTASTNCSCGWTNKARVVGGRETKKNEFPLMSGMMALDSRKIFCGATIITQNHALTASHCTVPMKGERLGLLVGGHNQEEDNNDNSKVIPIKETIEHENYDSRTFFNDIALLVLSSPITFNQDVGPACLPNKRINLVGEYLKVLGWGLTTHKGKTSQVLLKVNLRVFPIEECQKRYIRTIPTDNPFQICTYRDNKDSCQGDSGGPLIWHDPETNRFTLAALVSYGKICASKSPAVNTEVAYHLDWIQSKIAASGLPGQTCTKV